jgi:hypothetical protein
MRSAAQEALAEGLAQLDTELGETYTLADSGAAFVARYESNIPQQLPDYAGQIRETKLHAKRAQAAFAGGMPPAGAVITRPDGASARVARIEPGNNGWFVIVLADEFS